MNRGMTSKERVNTALSHREPDRVPVFLNLTMHGAKELGLSIREYYARAEYVVEGQLRLRRRFGHDCLIGVTYGAVEHEAFGGEALFFDDGPPNAGAPILRTREDIFALRPPDVATHPRLQAGLRLIRDLAEAARGEVHVVGGVVSPFSLPVMLLGFERYLELMFDDHEAFERLMTVTRHFCVEWANAQLAAGADAVGYACPLSAAEVIDDATWRRTGLPIAKSTLAAIRGSAAFSLASGRGLDRAADYVQTGAAAVGGVSARDDLAAWKRACAGKVAVIGNLNGLLLPHWSPAEVQRAVRACLRAAAGGGGYALADSHGEIPFQVHDDVLHAIMDAAGRWGTYPLRDDGDE